MTKKNYHEIRVCCAAPASSSPTPPRPIHILARRAKRYASANCAAPASSSSTPPRFVHSIARRAKSSANATQLERVPSSLQFHCVSFISSSLQGQYIRACGAAPASSSPTLPRTIRIVAWRAKRYASVNCAAPASSSPTPQLFVIQSPSGRRVPRMLRSSSERPPLSNFTACYPSHRPGRAKRSAYIVQLQRAHRQLHRVLSISSPGGRRDPRLLIVQVRRAQLQLNRVRS